MEIEQGQLQLEMAAHGRHPSIFKGDDELLLCQSINTKEKNKEQIICGGLFEIDVTTREQKDSFNQASRLSGPRLSGPPINESINELKVVYDHETGETRPLNLQLRTAATFVDKPKDKTLLMPIESIEERRQSNKTQSKSAMRRDLLQQLEECDRRQKDLNRHVEEIFKCIDENGLTKAKRPRVIKLRKRKHKKAIEEAKSLVFLPQLKT